MQYPSGPQNAPMPLSHTGNRLGYICSREVSGEKSLSDRSGPSQSKPFLSFEYARLFQLLLQGLYHLCAFHKGGLGSCNQNQIIPIFNFWGQKSGRLPYHPSGTVALHRISNFFLLVVIPIRRQWQRFFNTYTTTIGVTKDFPRAYTLLKSRFSHMGVKSSIRHPSITTHRIFRSVAQQ